MTKLNLLVIRTKDVERAVAFYSAMGLEFFAEQHGNGPEHFAAVMDDLVFEIYPAKEGDSMADVRLGFRVADLTAALDHLRQRGGRVVTEPKPSPWGLRAVVADPDGRKIELVEHGET